MYQRLVEDIKRKVERGLLKPGDKLPSTRQLMEEYEVSVTVVRYAMIALKSEGIVVGAQGRGVFIAPGPDTEINH